MVPLQTIFHNGNIDGIPIARRSREGEGHSQEAGVTISLDKAEQMSNKCGVVSLSSSLEPQLFWPQGLPESHRHRRCSETYRKFQLTE